MDLDKCAWKMVDSRNEFVMGIQAERCGEVAAVKILRPYRKSDLFLCEGHLNDFIMEWGLHNEVEILCNNWIEGQKPTLLSNGKLVYPEPKDGGNEPS